MKGTKANVIMKEAIRERGITQTKLAGMLGMLPHGLSESINRTRVSLDKFEQILDALRYDVVVVDRETGEIKWMLEGNDELL